MKKKRNTTTEQIRGQSGCEPYSRGDKDDIQAKDDPVIQHLRDSLDQVGSVIPESPPAVTEFIHLVDATRTTMRRRLVRDVTLFAVIAMAVASGWLFGMRLAPSVFMTVLIVVTVLSVLGTPLGFLLKKSSEERSG